MKKATLRINLEANDNDGTTARLINTYNLSRAKSQHIIELLNVGQIIKETGLADIVSGLDELPAYRNGTQGQRRAMLLAEMASLGGTVAPALSASDNPAAKPEKPTPEAKQEKPAPAAPMATLPKLGQQ